MKPHHSGSSVLVLRRGLPGLHGDGGQLQRALLDGFQHEEEKPDAKKGGRGSITPTKQEYSLSVLLMDNETHWTMRLM